MRVLPDGTLVDHDNNPLPDQSLPPPYIGLDPDIIALYAGIGVVTVIIGVLLVILFPEVALGAALGVYLFDLN